MSEIKYEVSIDLAVPVRSIHDLYAHLIDERQWQLQTVDANGTFEYLAQESIHNSVHGSIAGMLGAAVHACSAGAVSLDSVLNVRERAGPDVETGDFVVHGSLEMAALSRIVNVTYTTRYYSMDASRSRVHLGLSIATPIFFTPLLLSIKSLVESVLTAKQIGINETLGNAYNVHMESPS